MTPKSKAKELFKKYSKGKDKHGWSLCEWDSCAKQCALIAVDEILKSGCTFPSNNTYYGCNEEASEYWLEVKQEIENL